MNMTTLPELRDRLFALKGATMVTMIARTEPTLIGGKSCPLKGLVKVSRVNGVINWDYGNAVNRQRGRENQPTDESGKVEKFVPQPRKWGARLHEMLRSGRGDRLLPLVAKNWNQRTITLEELQAMPVEELYLEYKPQETLYYAYFLNGKPIDKAEAHKHVRPSYQPKTQETDKEIRLRDYKLTNIRQLNMLGETLVIAS
jgi:hypothetical protein